MTAHIRVSVDRESAADRATRKSANDIQARHGLGLLAHMRDLGFDLPLTIESDTSSAPAFLQADEAWVSEDMFRRVACGSKTWSKRTVTLHKHLKTMILIEVEANKFHKQS